jgi:leucyl/phenylalanyl-tRNA--protein transferase
MGLGGRGEPPLGWWSPDPRGVLPLDGLRVSRSLRRSARRLRTTVDTAFDAVVAGCADPSRSGRWITDEVAGAYSRLHRMGWAHSVEVWDDSAGSGPGCGPGSGAGPGDGSGGGAVLVGGLYGVGTGGLFAGESMFSTATDASKVALVRLVEVLRAGDDGRRLLDVQWRTDHLASLGVVEVSREEYLRRLARALPAPAPAW